MTILRQKLMVPEEISRKIDSVGVEGLLPRDFDSFVGSLNPHNDMLEITYKTKSLKVPIELIVFYKDLDDKSKIEFEKLLFKKAILNPIRNALEPISLRSYRTTPTEGRYQYICFQDKSKLRQNRKRKRNDESENTVNILQDHSSMSAELADSMVYGVEFDALKYEALDPNSSKARKFNNRYKTKECCSKFYFKYNFAKGSLNIELNHFHHDYEENLPFLRDEKREQIKKVIIDEISLIESKFDPESYNRVDAIIMIHDKVKSFLVGTYENYDHFVKSFLDEQIKELERRAGFGDSMSFSDDEMTRMNDLEDICSSLYKNAGRLHKNLHLLHQRVRNRSREDVDHYSDMEHLVHSLLSLGLDREVDKVEEIIRTWDQHDALLGQGLII